jgi:anhydro-N-acetylmuramic acid kinase
MSQDYTSLGLMSGTSGDGVDASIIKSDGKSKYVGISNQYFEYDKQIYKKIHNLKEKIHNQKDLINYSNELKSLEREITLFHAKVIANISRDQKVDIIGFHGQTIYHNSQEKISRQLGDGKLLSQLTKKNIVYDFRANDLKNGGEGAPLTPIFHQLITTQHKLDLPVCILNIGGISNITIVGQPVGSLDFTSRDIGPGSCLIDSWVRKNSDKNFDKDGILAAKGTRNEIIFEQAQELFSNRPNQNNISFDVNDFDVSFARGLSLEDGATTLTDFTARVIGAALFSLLSKVNNKVIKVLICGGGRKNIVLVEKIKKNTLPNIIMQPIDDYGIDGDFVESQAFAFLAIRSILKLPISFPDTTGVKSPCVGGLLIEFK